MITKTIGTILVIVALVIAILLVTGGVSVVPHIIGPISLTVVGVILLVRKTYTAHAAE